MLIEDWESADHYDKYKAWRAESGTSVLSGDLVAPHSVFVKQFQTL